MPQLDISKYPSQLFWLLIAFFTVYCIVAFFFTPRIRSIMHNRSETITHNLQTAEGLVEEYKVVKSEVEKVLGEARSLGFSVREETIVKAKDLVTEISKQAEIDLAKKIAREEEKIAKLHAQYKQSIPEIVAATSTEIIKVITDFYNMQSNNIN